MLSSHLKGAENMKKKRGIKIFCIGAVFLLLLPTALTASALYKREAPTNSMWDIIGNGLHYVHQIFLEDSGTIEITYTNGEGNIQTITIIVESLDELAMRLLAMAEKGNHIIQVDIYDHGFPGSQTINGSHICPMSDGWEIICAILGPNGIVYFHGCNVADSELNMDGPSYLQELANVGITVKAHEGTTIYIPGFGYYWEFGDWMMFSPEIPEEPIEETEETEDTSTNGT